MRRIALIVALCLTASVAAFAQTSLFEIIPERIIPDSTRQTADVVFRIKVNPDLLVIGSALELSLPIPGDPIIARLSPIAPGSLHLPKGQHAWRGTVADRTGGLIFVLKGDGWIRGQIQRGGKLYQIKSVSQGLSVIEVITPERAFPRDHPENVNPQDLHIRGSVPGGAVPDPKQTCADDPSEVDIMVVYTPAAKTGAGGTAAMEMEVAFAVAQANLAYLNSSVFHRLNLVYTGEVTYTEAASGTLSAALTALQTGTVPNVHALRNAHSADLVSMIVETADNGCGLGYYLDPPSIASAPYGFSAVLRSCAGGNFSLAHEVGHNMTADHDRANANSSSHSTAYNFNYGHIQPAPTGSASPWRTVMSYPNPCGTQSSTGSCARLPFFSNPNVSNGGDPTGVPQSNSLPEYNVLAFSNTAPLVSQFRCRTTASVANVWMKDRWEDTGGEPDANTANAPMWESPYIWNRTTQDTNFLHQHEHQNPELGSTNFVYVKLHNDGPAAASGKLELYWADPNTTNLNSASWNLIGSNTIASLQPGTTAVEFQWSNLPGAGHFCLLARWNGTNSSMSFSNIDQAVRNSNDMVWRNMNIVDLLPDVAGDERGQSFEVNMRGVPNGNENYLVLTNRIVNGKSVPWPKLARIVLTFDKEAIARANEIVGDLTRLPDGRFELTLGGNPAAIGPIRLDAGQGTKIGVRVIPQRAGVQAVAAELVEDALLLIRAVQARKEAVRPLLAGDDSIFAKRDLVIGGVSYEVKVPAKGRRVLLPAPTQRRPG